MTQKPKTAFNLVEVCGGAPHLVFLSVLLVSMGF